VGAHSGLTPAEKLNHERREKIMTWISKGDGPLLLKCLANGKPGFKVLPCGEDEDGIIFTSFDTLFAWTQRFMEQVQNAPHAQSYDEWLEENT
jgi:hypothetical protein